MRNLVLKEILLVICVLFCFTACKDDNDDKRSALDGIYSNRWSASAQDGALELTYNGGVLYGKEVWFEMAANAKANMTLLSIIPGENEVTIPGLSLQSTESGYSFSGNATTEKGATFDISGSVRKGQISVDLTSLKMPSNTFSSQGLWYTQGAGLKWTVSTNDFIWPILVPMGNGLLNNLILSVLYDVRFMDDGNIVAKYAPLPEDADIVNDMLLGGKNFNDRPASEWNNSPVNLATYYVEDGYMYVRPNIEMVIRQIMANQGTRTDESNNLIELIMNVYNQLTQWGAEGIRLAISGSGETQTLSLEKDQIEPLLPLLSYVSTLLPQDILETELMGMNMTLGDLLDNVLDDVINKTQTFEASIILSKSK